MVLMLTAAMAEEPIFNGEAYFETEDVRLPELFYAYSKDSKAEVHFDPLDELGRAGANYAIVTPQVLSGQRRDNISAITPSGFQQAQYSFIEGNFLYQRCHLIGSQFATSTEIPENLITGTTFLNYNGMYAIETRISAYVQTTGNSIFYSVIPDFREDDMVCRGVLIIAAALEAPEEFHLSAYCFNVQPGVIIDYSNGFSDLAATSGTVTVQRIIEIGETTDQDYILNIKSHVFHYPSCGGVTTMKENNKREYHGNRDELIDMGYKPCGTCKP